ncbi:MAG TPA: M1 family aminopeptidase [Burkholderiales bacterium]|nr:M1 family aminopeptidase [Burkholderiales bacterium]
MTRLWRAVTLLAGVLSPALALAGAARLALDVRLDPAPHALRVTAELKTGGEFRFELNRAFAIRSATVDGAPAAVELAGSDGELNLWRVPAQAGATLQIEYAGTLPALDPSLDYREVLRDRRAMVSPAGSYLPAASGWYPVTDAPFSYSVRLSLPRDQRGLVPGRLVEEKVSAQRYRARFDFDHPADGIELMAGPYQVREKIVPRRGAPPLRLRTYFYPELEPLAAGYLDDSQRYIERYSRMIGRYPFGSFSVVASPLPTGFGMPTLTYIGAAVLELPFIRATSLGHEVLHNWWGNGVYVDYASGNWSEGLTTFMADYAYKEEASPEAAREMRLAWLRDYASVPSGEQQSLAEFRSRTHGAAAAIGYGKSAMVFFMLRDLIGREAFEAGARDFWRAKRFQVASWADLRAAFERASGRDLAWFFKQWVERAGAPRLRIVSAHAQVRDGAVTLALAFAQSAQPYRLRVPVEIVTGAQAQIRWVDLERERQTVPLRLKRVPDGVRLDPALRVWRALDPEQLPPILRRWILARAPRLALASSGAEIARAAQVLAQALFENPAHTLGLTEISSQSDPVLLVGLNADVDAALARLGLPPRPKALADRGSAQVWTLQRPGNAPPIAVVSARDAAALLALRRPLPHYGAQSYLVFDGPRAVARGVWPAPGRLIPVSR